MCERQCCGADGGSIFRERRPSDGRYRRQEVRAFIQSVGNLASQAIDKIFWQAAANEDLAIGCLYDSLNAADANYGGFARVTFL